MNTEDTLFVFLEDVSDKYVTVIAGWEWEANLTAAGLLGLITLGTVNVFESEGERGFDLEVHVRCKKDIVHRVKEIIDAMGGTILE